MAKMRVIQEIEADPAMLARLFWEMDGNQQAEFFEQLDKIANPADFDKQMFVAGRCCSENGRRVMAIIGSNQ